MALMVAGNCVSAAEPKPETTPIVAVVPEFFHLQKWNDMQGDTADPFWADGDKSKDPLLRQTSFNASLIKSDDREARRGRVRPRRTTKRRCGRATASAGRPSSITAETAARSHATTPIGSPT